jgi:23S rRNA (cytidine2498-2'-O)-methyltransferase
MRSVHLCQTGYERFLAAELETIHGAQGVGAGRVERMGPGYVFSELEEGGEAWLWDLTFAHLTLLEPFEIPEGSVNAMAAGLLERLQADFRELRMDGPWYFDARVRQDQDGLARRATSVRQALAHKLKGKMGRVARLGTPELSPGPGLHRGWGMFFEDFSRVFASSRLHFGGQRRMADDPAAPSRSYLKVEEAYQVLGRGPLEGETVADLGAAPGGWSYSAARRGARVDAIDNGPLKAGAVDHPLIRHLQEDGFRFGRGADDPPYDWLFCDMVEDPYRILRLLGQWVERNWCRRFVLNLKFGRTNPVTLLQAVAEFRAGPLRDWPVFRVRHLFHDREEITLVGSSEGVP